MSFYVQNRSSRPKIGSPCQFQQFSSRGKFFHFQNFWGRLDEKRATAAPPLIDHFAKIWSERVLRRISCHGRNYSQPYFFKRNQSSDNCSHGFGAKFLLKKLSASDFSYERKSAFKDKHQKSPSLGIIE